MRRIFVLMAVMAVLVTDVAGKERTNGEMLSIARETLFRGDAAKAKGANVELRQVRDSRQLGVFTADGYGFVVVNRDDAGRTILGLSATDYDADNMPDGLKWWLENTEDALANGIKGSFYADILNVDAVIDNFITTTWNQQAPFNNKCPMVTSGSKSRTAPTGCVATALSQVMNYYKYPEQGKGEGTYSVTNDKKTTSYTVNISGTYDYNSLKDTYSRSETDDEAISTLLFEVGAACAMEYGYSGSGTSFIKAAQAMANNFSYDSLALNYHYGGHYLEDEWLTMIRKEMEANRPVLYGSADPTYGGHAFLFTGLDTEGKVWINWGWGGDGDGTVIVDNESPTTAIGDVKTDTVGENMGTYDLGGRKVNGKDNKTTRMLIRRNGKGVEKILEIK